MLASVYFVSSLKWRSSWFLLWWQVFGGNLYTLGIMLQDWEYYLNFDCSSLAVLFLSGTVEAEEVHHLFTDRWGPYSQLIIHYLWWGTFHYSWWEWRVQSPHLTYTDTIVVWGGWWWPITSFVCWKSWLSTRFPWHYPGGCGWKSRIQTWFLLTWG